LLHVSSHPPLRTGLAAFTASGSAPSVILHGQTHHEASLRISPAPPESTCGQLVRSLGTFAPVFPKARGLRQGECSPCGRRYRPPTTTPHPPLLSGIGMSSGVSPFLLSTSLGILRGASHVHSSGLLRRPVGGGLPTIPSALCGSPTRPRVEQVPCGCLFLLLATQKARLLPVIMTSECVGCPHR
jgi:hypothetical protein